MSFEDTKILVFNQCQKSDKALLFIYSDLEHIIEKIDGCKDNLEDSFTTKVRNKFHQVFRCLRHPFRSIENKHEVHRGKDSMKTFCEFLRGHTLKIINFKKKKVKLLTKEQKKIF